MSKYFVNTDYKIIRESNHIEDILCLAALIAADLLPDNATLENSGIYWANLTFGCLDCPIVKKCLACIINE